MKPLQSHGSLLSVAAAILLVHLWLLSTYVAGHSSFNQNKNTDGAAPSSSPTTASDSWQSFHKLAGCHKGDHVDGLDKLKQYLHQFGYISNPSSNLPDSFDDTLESALKQYQRNFNLKPTGLVDNTTVQMMVRPRCGNPDIVNGTTSMNSGKPGHTTLHTVSRYSFFPNTPKWPDSKRNLTYAFLPLNQLQDNAKVVFSRAFQRWTAVTPLTFGETDSYFDADIKIGFFVGNHGDGDSFDGVLGTLAHSFSPTIGWFHLDGDEDWVVDGDVTTSASTIAIDLESVVVHEIGHLLGLGHSSVEEAIMYPSLSARTRKTELVDDDIQGIQELYGSNPNSNSSSSSPSAPSNMERDTSDGGVAPSNMERDTSDGGVRITDLHCKLTMVMGAVASIGFLFVSIL